MNICKSDWIQRWEKEWDILECGDDGLSATDYVTFEGYWNSNDELVEVKVKRVGGGYWATSCSSDEDGKQIFGRVGTTDFTITFTEADPKAKLECNPSGALIALTTFSTSPSFGEDQDRSIARTAGRFMARYILRPAARKLAQGADYLFALADSVEAPDSGGRPGSWTAEEGGTNAPVVYYDERPHVRIRRRA